MKYIKKYENINIPQVGDYVIRKNINIPHYKMIFDENEYENFINYLSTNIGQVNVEYAVLIRVKYNPPQKYKKFFKYLIGVGYYLTYNIDDILLFSDNKKDLEMKIKANKYNL